MKCARAFAISLSLALFVGVAAFADTTDTETFTISDLTGPLAGNTYTGAFSWDPSVSDNLTAFSTDFPGWVDGGGTLADLTSTDAEAVYDSGAWSVYVFYVPGPVGNTDAFFIDPTTFFPTNIFGYGATAEITANGGVISGAGSGTVTYGSLVTSVTPEPASWLLFATGAVGAFGMFRRKRKLAA
jgi:hypothetical protein